MKKRAILLVVFLMVIFMSLVSSMNINVSSPTNNGVYASNPVSIDASSDEAVNWTVYVDGTQWFKPNNINVISYNISPPEDVAHNLTISASNSSISIDNTITFQVDTLSPNIISQTPANNSNVSKGNINFSVTYTEANLNYTKIYWKNSSDSVYREENVAGCESGTSKSCSKIIDFSLFLYGTNISYFFSLTDILLRNSNGSVYIFSITCSPSWSCTTWSDSSNNCGTRTCTDSNCGTDNRTETQTCSSCTPSWSCTTWSDSSNNCGTRTCTDSNSCGTNTDKPSESQSCSETTQTTEDTIQNLNYFLTESQLNNGTLRTLKGAGDKITFKIKNESHSLELIKMFSDKVSIKISSNEQYANLTLNEVKKFDLTADNYYDVSVTLKRLTSNESDILLNTTSGKVPEMPITTDIILENVSTETNATEGEVTLNETKRELKFSSKLTGAFFGAIGNIKRVPIYFVVAFVIFILGLAATTFMHIRKRKKRKKQWGYR